MKTHTLAKHLTCTIAAVFASFVGAQDTQEMIKSAMSAAPASVTENATFKAPDGTVLKKGSNGYTCYPQTEGMGPMCNQAGWDELIHALMNKQDYTPKGLSISYMLAGEGTAPGVSNSDPYETDPTKVDDWVKEGPHLMIILPDKSMLEGISTNPSDPVYVMWGDTPYAHIMIRISEE
ncbi:hypothetical protein [Thalassotalea aquiviva]|uniref:hypothetical protein n=1 Tax=Thalassotalea aquiviva TaxID=3242415 RepID=UPI003529D946